jgi:hypothetical protein
VRAHFLQMKPSLTAWIVSTQPILSRGGGEGELGGVEGGGSVLTILSSLTALTPGLS